MNLGKNRPGELEKILFLESSRITHLSSNIRLGVARKILAQFFLRTLEVHLCILQLERVCSKRLTSYDFLNMKHHFGHSFCQAL